MNINLNSRFVKRVVKGVVLAYIITSCLSGCTKLVPTKQPSTTKEPTPFSYNIDLHNLPSENNANQKLQQLLGKDYQSYLLGENTLVRLPCPIGGNSIKVNVEFETTPLQREIIEEVLAEYNYVFQVINPNYKFEVNYEPTQEDLSNPYYIDLRKTDSFKENQKGMAQAIITTKNYSTTISGEESYNNIIVFTEDCLNSPQAFMGIAKHEFGHILGRGDAYNKENIAHNTIMYSGEKYGASLYSKYSSLQPIDVAILDATYRAPDNPYSDEYIQNFIDTYEKHNPYTYEKYRQSKDFDVYRQKLSEVDINNIIQSILESEYDESVKTAVIKTLKTTNCLNQALGSTPGALGECLKQNNRYTYMSLDADNRVFITQRSEYSESSGSRPVTINNGLMRIGDEYSGKIFFSVGDYVISLDYKKDYFNFNLTISECISGLYKPTEMSCDKYFEIMKELHNQAIELE